MFLVEYLIADFRRTLTDRLFHFYPSHLILVLPRGQFILISILPPRRKHITYYLNRKYFILHQETVANLPLPPLNRTSPSAMHLPVILGSASLFLAVASVSGLNDSNTAFGGDILERNEAIQSQFLLPGIRGVRKMTDDEGEKFFHHYWQFSDTTPLVSTTFLQDQPSEALAKAETDLLSRVYTYRPAVPVDHPMPRSGNLSPLLRRDFQCPADTHSCAAINRPESCCSRRETCQLVKDTGSGDVGCCPQGQSCSGSIGTCQAGYTNCAASLGGGCCIPGYECVTGGCARVYTVTITAHSTVMTSTITASMSTSTSTTVTTSQTATSTGDLVPPARPTSLSTATTSQMTGDICPIGFYACSAVYRGGCCRTGRDCDTTSCPTTSSSMITTDGRTIVVPAETTAPAVGTGGGRCASGWFSCADTVGGGCCPTGYACGSSCTAVATSTVTGTVAKEAPRNLGSRMNVASLMTILAVSMVSFVLV
ncbi:hypothetical protein BDV59DRAFT_189330 [Aspergillus ambiguus]|uniref:putative GPI anchored protein n=1 Tax=Aspergillus ambiguus TaxID=176160 RepID=UPI003CCDB33F